MSEKPGDASFHERHLIDLFKGITFIVILGMMVVYRAWNRPSAWLYLGMHGSYGLLWALKGQLFPDRAWQKHLTLGRALFLSLGLSAYWLGPWLLIALDRQPPVFFFALAPALYAFGIFFHFGGDLQKSTALELEPNRLITSRLFARVRNMNYLGELLIYLSFALVAFHWLPFLVLLIAVIFVWLPNMRAKDKSLARYPDFAAYRKRSWLFLPPFF